MVGESFTADGDSPVVQYFLEVLRQRDRLYEATRRDRRIYEYENPYFPLGRRDKRRLAWEKGTITGWKPAGRVAIFLSRFQPRYGDSKLDSLRRSALAHAANKDDRVVRDAIYAVHEAHERLLEIARAKDGINDQDIYDAEHFRTTAKLMDLLLPSEPEEQQSAATPVPPKTKKAKRRSTPRGGARAAIIAAFTLHHKYSHGVARNPSQPIGTRELATKAKTSQGSVTNFFKWVSEFGSQAEYAALCRRNPGRLSVVLARLNGDYSSEPTYGKAPRSERDPRTNAQDDD